MNKIAEKKEKQGPKIEFRVERAHGHRLQHVATTAEKELADLADARVLENLFYLLEKYKRQSAQLTSMLVKLLYQIIRVHPTNIVVFFELSYFMRIYRICSDPLLRDKRQGLRYQEMVSMLQYVLRQFFKCAEVNGCVFVELLFRKVHENKNQALLESHTAEFAAILDNYEDDGYKRILERMKAGETLDAMREKHKAALEGSLPWTAEEDNVLRERYSLYADHPLCCELLAAELPEDSRRTARHVRKRLQELGLIETPGRLGERASNAGGDTLEIESHIGDSQQDVPPSPKKPRTIGQEGTDGVSQMTEDETLEMDLDRLLDAAMDAEGDTLQDTVMHAGPASGSQGGQDSGQDTLDLE